MVTTKFNSEIAQFRNGTLQYTSSFNSVGNLFFRDNSDKFNETFLKFQIRNFEYDVDRINRIYSTSFTELTESTESTESVVESGSDKVKELEKVILELTEKLSDVGQTSKPLLNNELIANRDVIIQLRIAAGQGKSATEFSSEFPYFKI